MISSIALESAKDQGLHNLTKEWTNTGFKISRWIFENRGCSQILSTAYDIPNIKIKRLRVNNLCSLLHNTESYFAENLLLESLQQEDYKSAIGFASLSIIDQEITPISQSSYESSAFVRLNNLVRLAYSANKEKNWCLAYKGNDRAISLAEELGIEPLEAWSKARDFAANYYEPVEEDLWSTRYGSAGDKKVGIAVPIEQVPPVYPLRLLQRQIEGCVMLNFTVNEEGKTEDIKVEWTTEDGFSQAAIESAKTYIYSIPKTGEETTKIFNYQTLIVFKIEDPNKSNDYVPAGCE
jgi:TonB family C-terminal domain